MAAVKKAAKKAAKGAEAREFDETLKEAKDALAVATAEANASLEGSSKEEAVATEVVADEDAEMADAAKRSLVIRAKSPSPARRRADTAGRAVEEELGSEAVEGAFEGRLDI